MIIIDKLIISIREKLIEDKEIEKNIKQSHVE